MTFSSFRCLVQPEVKKEILAESSLHEVRLTLGQICVVRFMRHLSDSLLLYIIFLNPLSLVPFQCDS